ncbi:MAG: DUF2029 domain-containing protein [Deltaproteobacteria bacterium]|nr:MAG: DUF2029 domain-containing protein [Deltaproteobacteria bacterium]
MHRESETRWSSSGSWWRHLDRLLTRERQRYALFAGAALWAVWLISASMGPGVYDLAGQLIGADFMQYYAAGHVVRMGDSSHLYDFPHFERLEVELVGEKVGPPYFYFITPPFLAWLFVPLAFLPYIVAFSVWTAAGFSMLFAGLRWLGSDSPWYTLMWAVTWFPVFATISFGQNALLSFFILVLVYRCWLDDRPFLAGLMLSLIMYKPHLAVGLSLLWLLRVRRDWPALVGLSLGSVALAVACFVFAPEASREYVIFAVEVLPTMKWGDGFPLWHAHSMRGFWLLLLPAAPLIAEVLTFALLAVGLVYFARSLWRFNQNKRLMFPIAVLFTLWATPHAMIYEWSILLVPAVLLWRQLPEHRPLLRVLFALVWATTFIAGPLVVLQLAMVPVALQVTIPVFTLSLIMLWRALNQTRT